MKRPPFAALVGLAVCSFALTSCTTVRKAGSGTAQVFRKSTSAVASGIAAIPRPKMPDLASLWPGGSKIKVVEPRESDLKELPTGQELAAAHRRQGFGGFWFFPGDVNFMEPDLPAPGAELDGSLLPPLPP